MMNPECRIEEIPVSKIRVDESYQRKLDDKRAEKIALEYDIHRDRPIDVSFRDAYYWCFDGGHRLNAAKKRGLKTIIAQVHYGLSYADECMYFANQHKDQRNVGSIDAWNAAVLAGTKCTEVWNINIIAKRFGLTVNPKNPAGNNIISCPSTIRSYYRKHGDNGLTDLFFIITYAWNNMPHNTDNRIISAFDIIRNVYGAEMTDNHWNHMRDALSRTTPLKILQEARGVNHRVGTALRIIEAYNKGLKRGGKNRLDPSKIVNKYGI